MKLSDWIEARAPGKGPTWLAARLRLPYHTARRILLGERLPDPEAMRRIARVTRYEVTANDFYDIKPPAKRAA